MVSWAVAVAVDVPVGGGECEWVRWWLVVRGVRRLRLRWTGAVVCLPPVFPPSARRQRGCYGSLGVEVPLNPLTDSAVAAARVARAVRVAAAACAGGMGTCVVAAVACLGTPSVECAT